MPLYEYECQSCRRRFERRQSVHDAPVRECPECGEAVRKVLHPVGVVFKGSGWYVTDSRKPEPAATAASSGGDSSRPAESQSAESQSAESQSAESQRIEKKSETKSGASTAAD
jgi:putative FmdB family regulatory protein